MFKDALANIPYEKSVLEYKQDGKFGIIDYFGKKITNAQYDAIESLLYKEGCLLIKQNDKYGLININGKEILKPEYDSISADGYYEEETKYQKAGLIVGKKLEDGYRYGYAKSNGNVVLDVEYNGIERITEIPEKDGIYLMASKNGQIGVYKEQKQIIKHGYDEIEYNKSNEVFIVQKNNKQGMLDKEGNAILKLEYDNITISDEYVIALKDELTYFYDKNGNEIELNSTETTITTDNKDYYITINSNEQYGVKNKEGNIIIPNQYAYIEFAYDNYFITTKDGKCGVFDVVKRQEIIAEYTAIQRIEDKKALQAVWTGENYTLIDIYNENLEKVVSMQNAKINIENTYFTVTSKNDRKYFDNSGNEVENTKLFPNLQLYAFKQNDKWGFKEKDGNVKISPIYDMVTELNEYGFAGIMNEGKWGVINSKGTLLVEPIYELENIEPDFIGEYYKLNLGYGMIYYTKELRED